jgi:putative endonuclease
VSSPPESFRSKSAKTSEIGQIAETFVAQWLTEQGWQIIEQRWHCRWGELDLVMLTADQVVAFVEVKARSQGNWDSDGLLAMTATKQHKLVRAAQAFLADQSQWAEFPCRFDVAIVQIRRRPSVPPTITAIPTSQPIQLGTPVTLGTYSLTLQHYLPAAFE